MADRVRPYLFYDVALSICSTCYRKVEGKIVFQDDKVLLLKQCPVHGPERVRRCQRVGFADTGHRNRRHLLRHGKRRHDVHRAAPGRDRPGQF